MCTFGLRQVGSGLFLLDRRWDATRVALSMALGSESNLRPPPLKRLCVESQLPSLARASAAEEQSDPYGFACGAATAEPSSASQPRSLLPNPSNHAVRNASHHHVAVAPSPSPAPRAPTKPPPRRDSLVTPTSNGGVFVPSARKKKSPTPNPPPTAVTPATSAPVSFPFRTHLSALSRLQMPARAKEAGGAMLVATADVLNGQVSVNSGVLLHSVTVSKPGVTGGATLLQSNGPRGSKGTAPALTKPAGGSGGALNRRGPHPPGRTAMGVVKNHHQVSSSVPQGLALPELMASSQVSAPTASPLSNGLPSILGQSKLYPSPNHTVPGSLEAATCHPAHLAKGARNGSRPHQARSADPGASIAHGTTVGTNASLQATMPTTKQQQLYQQVLASQVQAQLMPSALKLPLLLPNDERRHRPPQQQLKVPGGSMPT